MKSSSRCVKLCGPYFCLNIPSLLRVLSSQSCVSFELNLIPVLFVARL